MNSAISSGGTHDEPKAVRGYPLPRPIDHARPPPPRDHPRPLPLPASARSSRRGRGSRALAGKAPIEIARALFEGEQPAAIVDAFAEIDRFTHGGGPEALEEGAQLARFALDAEAIAQGPADVAAEVIAAARGKGATATAARKALARAHVRMDRFFVHRPSYELVGELAGAGAGTAGAAGERSTRDVARDLERLVVTWLKGSFRALWLAEGDAGRLHAAILYVAPPSVEVSWPKVASARASAPSRDVGSRVAVDVARVDPAERRLLVTPARAGHLAPLARVFGGALYADPDHFGLRPSFSFKTLQALGAAGFARLAKPAGVRAWAVVGCQWDSGREELIETRSEDALASLEARTSVDGGHFPRLTLRVEPEARGGTAAGKGTAAAAAVDLFIQLPHRITVSDPRRQEAPARGRPGEGAGHVRAGGAPRRRADAGAVGPLRVAVARGAGGRRLRAPRAKEDPDARESQERRGLKLEHRWLGSSVKLTPLRGEEVHLATPLDFSLPAFEVDDSEAHAWRLDEAPLAKHLAAAMGLRAGTLANVPGAIALGALVVKSGRAHVYYAAGGRRRASSRTVRAACKMGTAPVIVVPRGRRFAEEGIAQVEMDLHEQFGVAGTTGLVTGRVATALGVEDEVEAWRLAAPDEVLVIDRKAKRAWLLGVELVHLLDGSFRLFERLGMEHGGVVDVRVLGSYVSSSASDPDVVVRKRRGRLGAQIEKSFEAAGVLLPPDLVEQLVMIDGRGGYRLGVGCKVV